MIQPNVYWTLLTPFATFVGLYTNIPEGGVVRPDQQDWFRGELDAADPNNPLIVTMHHPIHSLDKYNSGSKAMAEVLKEAIQQSQRSPDLVFAGHVHNYQWYAFDRDARPMSIHGRVIPQRGIRIASPMPNHAGPGLADLVRLPSLI
jgi:acid phosphatase type 7